MRIDGKNSHSDEMLTVQTGKSFSPLQVTLRIFFSKTESFRFITDSRIVLSIQRDTGLRNYTYYNLLGRRQSKPRYYNTKKINVQQFSAVFVGIQVLITTYLLL